MHKVKVSVTKKTIAVPVDNIKRVCVHTALKYSPIDLVIMQPNEYINTIDQCYFTCALSLMYFMYALCSVHMQFISSY